MGRFLARRLVLLMLVLVAVSIAVFSMSRVAGDPRYLYLDEHTSKEQWEEWGRQMGLEKPVTVQYLVWLGKALRGDLGTSRREHRSVAAAILERVPATLELGLGAWILAFLLGWPIGILSAVKRGTILDQIGRTFALFGQALPPFWLGIMLILLFAVQLNWLPTSRRGGIEHYVLPTITLGWLAAAGQMRLVRSAMLNVLDSEYVKLARAKGVSSSAVILKHALKNALITPLTYAGLVLAGFLTGTVVTETVFAWPGLGRLAVTSVYTNDFPLLAGCVLFFTALYVGVNLLVDVAYGYVDPRIRYN